MSICSMTKNKKIWQCFFLKFHNCEFQILSLEMLIPLTYLCKIMPQPCFHVKGMFHFHSTLIINDGSNIMALQIIYMWHDKQENQTNKKETKTGFPGTAGMVAERSRKWWQNKYRLYYSSSVNIIYSIVSQVCASLTYATERENK